MSLNETVPLPSGKATVNLVQKVTIISLSLSLLIAQWDLEFKSLLKYI